MIKNIIKLLFGKFDNKTLYGLYHELSASSLTELQLQTDFVSLGISKSISLIFELGKDFADQYENTKLRLLCADNFNKYRNISAVHFKVPYINNIETIGIFGDRYIIKVGQLYTGHRRYYQLDADFIILYDELFNTKIDKLREAIMQQQEEDRQRRTTEEIERLREVFLKQQQEEAIKNHREAIKQQQEARIRAADKLNESYRRKQQNERTSQKESFNKYRDMFNDSSGYFNWGDFSGNTYDGGYTKVNKPNNKRHPKWELYKNLCSTIMARKTQLDEIGNSHENWEELKNEHNQAVRTAKKLKDKYKF